MARSVRTLPRPGALVELTQRTLQGRFLLKPSPQVNALVVGCLARAQKHTAAQVHAVAVLSSHLHILASFASVEKMATFMCLFKCNLSKELGKVYDREGPMWAGRYKSIPVSDEPEAQIARLRYLLSQGCKEGLVLSPLDWPGVHSAEALLHNVPLRGIWINRTRLWAARQRNEDVTARDVTSEQTLDLAPLPCWRHMTEKARTREISSMIRDIEQETRAMHERNGTAPAGAQAVLDRRPDEKAKRLPRTPQPRFHAATDRVRKLLLGAYREFVAAYREAAEKLAAGDRAASFPENCYPPGLPFVEPVVVSH